MNQRSDSADLTSVGSVTSHVCAYCETPLPSKGQPPRGVTQGERFCCYGCRVLYEAGQKPMEHSVNPESSWFKIAVGAVLAGQSMLLGLTLNLSPVEGIARTLLHLALILSSLASLGVLGRPLAVSVWDDLQHRRITVELLFLVGIAGALGASLHSTLQGTGAVYYEVVAVLVTVYSVGKTLGARSRARALAETRHLQHTFARCHRLAADGSLCSVRVEDIQPGDRVRVLAGEPIPIDGTIASGRAFVCETPLTGEPFPVVRREGDTVFAGSYSEDGELWIVATVAGTKRQFDRLVAALEDARERPSRLQAEADRLVRWFLPVVMFASLATWAYWSWRSGWSAGVFNALAVLLVACPCAMGLATPVALWSGLAALAARGLVVRGGNALETLADLSTVVFDKTGTLSEESFSLVDFCSAGSATERARILGFVSAVQSACSHPVARAFRGLSGTYSVLEPASARPVQLRSLKTVPARGVEAWLVAEAGTEHHLRVGQRELMTNLSSEPELLAALQRKPTDQLVYVECDGHLEAIGAVRERVRTSTEDSIRALAAMGLECRVMTGDRAARATELLQQVRIEGGLTPELKANRVAHLEASGSRVAFVGDGVNDAPAMNTASLGIAMAHGAGVTTSRADAILYGGDLRVLPYAVTVARHVRRSIRSNLMFAAAYNLVGVFLAATGMLHPVVSALLMVASSFTVSWRALRSTEQLESCCVPSLPEAQSGKREQANSWLPFGQARHRQYALSLLFLAQVPFLVYLGELSTFASLGLTCVFLLGAIGMACYRPGTAETDRFASMTFAMLSLGNWGMILGWWADAGFGPVTMGCPGCDAKSFGLGAIAAMPWMNVGMIVLGVPPMLQDRSAGRKGLSRTAIGLLSTVGMIVGMAFGGFAALHWLGTVVSNRFLLSLGGMTIGMLLGMFLACELGQALLLAWKRRR